MPYMYMKMDTEEIIFLDEWKEEKNLEFLGWINDPNDKEEINNMINKDAVDELIDLVRMKQTGEKPEMQNWISKRIKELEEFLANSECNSW